MAMVKKSITVTDQQNDWIKAQIKSGHYGNESEVVRELIRDRQVKQRESVEEIAAIRAALIVGEKSGITNLNKEQILAEIKDELRINGDL